ncbi:hypothetical protein Poly21_14150 [Allorhodopirellula heiligendammensis]|uniref:Uncharacterized protein n=1 Tax=Allorhodopirellula heiligendammensis TaxID=2714739 RepID=A0A5C6C3Z3_9BACT|nr:hypothetical protein Poly21_14150 [Allorhodopirellula heiligendammensis]
MKSEKRPRTLKIDQLSDRKPPTMTEARWNAQLAT